jgi:hypothetical protein
MKSFLHVASLTNIKALDMRFAIATAVQFAPGGCTENRNKYLTLQALPEVPIGFVIKGSP